MANARPSARLGQGLLNATVNDLLVGFNFAVNDSSSGVLHQPPYFFLSEQLVHGRAKRLSLSKVAGSSCAYKPLLSLAIRTLKSLTGSTQWTVNTDTNKEAATVRLASAGQGRVLKQ